MDLIQNKDPKHSGSYSKIFFKLDQTKTHQTPDHTRHQTTPDTRPPQTQGHTKTKDIFIV